MSFFAGTNVLTTVEPILLGGVVFALVRGKAYGRFPVFFAYLICRLSFYAVLSVLLHAVRGGLIERHLAYSTYYYVYWIGYLAEAVAAFMVIQEVFSHLMEAYSGVRRLGVVMAFRWVTLISVLIAVALAVYPAGHSQNLLIAATSGLMRCIAVLELCLLAFVVISMQTLRIPPRSRDFGIALGLGIVASADLFGYAFAFRQSTMASIANYCSQIVVTLAAAIWAAYFFAPALDRAVETATPPKASPWGKWNEIASALGDPEPAQIALSTSTEFFLQDVERAVDKVLGNHP